MEDLESEYIKLAGAKLFKPVNLSPSKLPSRAKPPVSTINKIAVGINELAKNSLKTEESVQDKEFWVFASQVADRIFLIVFSLMLFASMSVILSEVPEHYTFF